ncbi:MAG: universal stress protein [Planctomycetota bacterium]
MIVGNRIPAGMPRILVPADEGPSLIRFAIRVAQNHRAALLALHVQHQFRPGFAHLTVRGREAMTFAADLVAQHIFQHLSALCARANVPVLQIYTIHDNPGEVLLDHAATWGVEALIMGTSRRQTALPPGAGPRLEAVYRDLPDSIPMLIRA